ncbi:hypothetical protein [Nitrospirillum viridazoti]|uniref:Aspartyl protease n=1 Tax=Nitrospirillum amazonense TaxID=28077 RepID=A0A560HWE0_9PROT|nr:hypothetical protein [Nitrospirillum amazonense]TWB50948.1 hypothetical protein FBZ92_12240 [Nitrospirillum amazonense]
MTAALMMAAGTAHAEPAQSCHLTKAGVLPLELDGYQLLVKAIVNGKDGYFRIGTSSNATILSSQAMERLMEGTKLMVEAPKHGSIEVRKIHLDSLELGSWRGRDVEMLAGPIGDVVQTRGDVIGVLGMNILGQYDMEFDLAHSLLTLYQPEGCEKAELAYWSDTYSLAAMDDDPAPRARIRLPVTVNGQMVHAELSTSFPISFLDKGLAQNLGSPIQSVPDSDSRNELTALDSISVGDETVKHAKIRIADLFQSGEAYVGSRLKTSYNDGTRLFLGVDFLKAHRVYVAFSQRKIYFTYQGGPLFQLKSGEPGQTRRATQG